MSNSSLVDVKVPAYSGNYTKGRSGKKIIEITIHHMAAVLSAEQCGKVFQRKGRNGSSHYGIGNDGRIGLYVDEKNTAWTNSNWEANCRAVTIEVSNSKTGGDWPVSDKALNSLIKLVADIAKRNNITLVKGKTLTWHRMYAKTTCPGDYLLSKMDYIIQKANEINNPKNTNSDRVKSWQVVMNKVYKCKLVVDGSFGPACEKQANKHQLYKKKIVSLRIRNDYVKWLQNRLKELGYYKGSIDGSFWSDTDKAVRQFQKAKKLTADGYVGLNTVKALLK